MPTCPECGNMADDVDKIAGSRVFYHGTTESNGVISADSKCYPDHD